MLEEVLAQCREEAAQLRLHHHPEQASSMELVCDRVAEDMAAYLDWLTEKEARSRSGKSVEYLRSRFPGWIALGLARWDEERPRPQRLYRRIIIPLRSNVEAARAAARRQAGEERVA